MKYNGLHACDIKNVFLQLDNSLQFRLSRIRVIEYIFITEISDIEKMCKTLNKCITTLAYADKTPLVLSDEKSGVSLCSFTTVIGGIVSASAMRVFLMSDWIFKMFMKTMKRMK